MEHTCLSCMAYVLRELGDWDDAAELCEELRSPGATPGCHAGRRRRPRRDPRVPRRPGGRSAAARAVPRHGVAPGRRLDGRRQRRRARLARGARGRPRPGPRALPLPAGALGAQRGPPLRGLGPALGRVLLRPPRLARRRARLHRGAVQGRGGHRPSGRPGRPRARARGDGARRGPSPTPPSSSPRRRAARGLDIPFERAQIQLRAGVALAAAGQREEALERLGEAHRAARRLGAPPLAAAGGR